MRKAFTLIELLVVIAIIAILAVVVVLTLNPAALLQQSRDANRVSDMATLNSAINFYETDQSGASSFSLGSSSVIYVSIPDPTATTTAGSNCSSLGLPTLPSTYTYHCAGPNYYRNINGTGWIPVNFSNISAGTSLSNLPVDPTNQSSSRLYYTYTTNGSQFVVTAPMESAKYQLGGSNDQITGDGAPLATVYAKGSNLTLEPLDYGDPTLAGYWPLNEGTGNIVYDESANNATGSWNGTQAGTNGYYSAGKVQSWAGAFDGSTDYVNVTSTVSSSLNIAGNLSIAAWVNWSTFKNYGVIVNKQNGGTSVQQDYSLWTYTTFISGQISNGTTHQEVDLNYAGTMTTGNWYFIVFTVDGTNLNLYVNGALKVSTPQTVTPAVNAYPFQISNAGVDSLNGYMGNVRIYNRVLSAAQIAAMYNGGK